MQVDDIRQKFGQFRILIMGRANVGKTMILKKICNSMDDPEIYNEKGEKVGSCIVLWSGQALRCAISSIKLRSRNPQG